MPYFRKGTDDEVLGTLELCTISFPITRDPNSGRWTYDEGEGRVFEEGSDFPDGKPLFLTRSGEEIGLAELEWRERAAPPGRKF